MARQRNSTIRQHIITVYRDEQGNEIQTAEYAEETVRLPDGSVLVEKTAENFALSSGELTNPSQSSGANPALPLGLCDSCGTTRSIFPWGRRRTTRLCSAEQLKPCARCGGVFCRPDIEVGHLVQAEHIRFGVRLLDGPRHCLIAGRTNAGKTTLIRIMINAVEALNVQREQEVD